MAYLNILDDGATPVRTLTINRPSVRNALDKTTLQELTDAFTRLDHTPEVRCVIVTGAGDKAFVAGADVAFMAELGPAEARAFADLGHRLGNLIEGLAAPVIAAVNGFALGGGLELALVCDFIVASETAKLGFPEVGLGVIPGFGGSSRLARRIGIAAARQWLYTGAIWTAAEAQTAGLVNTVVSPAALLTTAHDLASSIACRGALAVAAAKRALRHGEDTSLTSALAFEKDSFAGLFGSVDQREGMRAFLEKRPAKFQGQ